MGYFVWVFGLVFFFNIRHSEYVKSTTKRLTDFDLQRSLQFFFPS